MDVLASFIHVPAHEPLWDLYLKKLKADLYVM